MLEDRRLKRQFRRGSRDALARIYEKYLDSMLTLAMGLLNDVSEAQDVVRGSLHGYPATSAVSSLAKKLRSTTKPWLLQIQDLSGSNFTAAGPFSHAALSRSRLEETINLGRYSGTEGVLSDQCRQVIQARH
jgi:hypothetical protein